MGKLITELEFEIIGELENKKGIILKNRGLNSVIDSTYTHGVVGGLDVSITLTKTTLAEILGEIGSDVEMPHYKIVEIITHKIGGE